MKRLLTLACCLLTHALAAQNSDTLHWPRYPQGLGVFAEIGLLNNPSLERLRDQLAPLGVTLSGTKATPFGIQFYRRQRRADVETRLWVLMGSEENAADNRRLARPGGYGIGLAVVPRLVDTRRVLLGPVLGYDVALYRLRIDAPNLSTTVPIQNLLANPLTYQSQVLRGMGLTLNLGAAVAYRFRLFPKWYDRWQLNARLGYHVPFVYSREWRFDQKTVGGLDGYRPANLYLHVGLVTFPNVRRLNRWAGR